MMSKFKYTTERVESDTGYEALKVVFSGIISVPTIDEFRDALTSVVEVGLPVLLDFAQVTYINSTGLGKMVIFSDELIEKNLPAGFVNLNDDTTRLIRMLGLSEVLTIYKEEADALASFEGGGDEAKAEEIHEKKIKAESGRFDVRSSAPPPRLPEANIIIGMNPIDPLAKMLVRALSGEHGTITVTENRDQILEALKAAPVDIAILDEALPLYQQICIDLKTSPGNHLVSIIKINSKTAKTTGASMQVSADEVISEPFDIQELFALATSEYGRCSMESLLFVREIQLVFSSAKNAVEEGIAMLGKQIESSGMSMEHRETFFHAVREAIDNANRHGNQSDPFKRIKTLFILDKEKITITVEDEGEGFNFKARLRKAENNSPLEQTRNIGFAENRGGLGISIMSRCCDKVEYIAPGNHVRLVKYL